MLRNELYTVLSISQLPGAIDAVLQLDPAHSIFEGHFPGQPVLPGVCLMQIIREMLELATGGKWALQKAAQVKFVRMIDPRINQELVIHISYEEKEERMHVTAAISAGEPACRFQGVFVGSK